MVALRPTIFIGALLWGFIVAGTASAQLLPCVSQATDPCLINSTTNIPAGTYDIRPRSLSVANKQLTLTTTPVTSGTVKILANNITFQPGARFISIGTSGNIAVDLEATGFIDIQSQGTSKSKIDTSSNFGGGDITLHAGTNLTVSGPLTSNANNPEGAGFGGSMTLRADTGSIILQGDPSEGMRSNGKAAFDSQGGGGSTETEIFQEVTTG